VTYGLLRIVVLPFSAGAWLTLKPRSCRTASVIPVVETDRNSRSQSENGARCARIVCSSVAVRRRALLERFVNSRLVSMPA